MDNKEKMELVIYETDEGEIKLDVKTDGDTVWLNRNQMADQFGRDVKTIGKHINNALIEEIDPKATVAKFATVQNEGDREIQRNIEYYNLDVITSVGYRVKSKRGIAFIFYNEKSFIFRWKQTHRRYDILIFFR